VGVMSLFVEQLWVVIPGSPYFDSASALSLTAGLMLCGGLIAFLMVWVEFTVINETSALTFMVAGTFKEIVTGAHACLLPLSFPSSLSPWSTCPLDPLPCNAHSAVGREEAENKCCVQWWRQ